LWTTIGICQQDIVESENSSRNSDKDKDSVGSLDDGDGLSANILSLWKRLNDKKFRRERFLTDRASRVVDRESPRDMYNNFDDTQRSHASSHNSEKKDIPMQINASTSSHENKIADRHLNFPIYAISAGS